MEIAYPGLRADDVEVSTVLERVEGLHPGCWAADLHDVIHSFAICLPIERCETEIHIFGFK